MNIIMLEDFWYKKKFYQYGEIYNLNPILAINLISKCVAEDFDQFEEKMFQF
ncbi:hypothetical protein [Priestia flexa]|uniref:hypothetical protein n=1 Tax=Priestia flexa TaxID=86664 RepID=UPI000B1EF3BB|nr:hypothetical protein [Priestia flexa]